MNQTHGKINRFIFFVLKTQKKINYSKKISKKTIDEEKRLKL